MSGSRGIEGLSSEIEVLARRDAGCERLMERAGDWFHKQKPRWTRGAERSRVSYLGPIRIAQCLNLEREFHHTASQLCILRFEPLK